METLSTIQKLPFAKRAYALMTQQFWHWGRDVLHCDGNYLMKLGFDRVPPPRKHKGCPSLYSLQISEEERLILRGFGAIWEHRVQGKILLLREPFAVKYSADAEPLSNCWTRDNLPMMSDPTSAQRQQCLKLLERLLDWIIQYEQNALIEFGVEDRQRILKEWDNGKRKLLTPADVPEAWKRMKQTLIEHPELLIPDLSQQCA